MKADQPDLFGQYDRAQEMKALWERPWTCRACGTTEPNGYLLQNNHGYRPDGSLYGYTPGEHPAFGAQCIAQYLVTNHITYAVQKDMAEFLAERMERGRALGLDVEAIVARARQEAS